MKPQQLDEDGLASSYLLLAMLLPVCSYLLYSLLRPKPTFKCTCTACSERKIKPNIQKIVLTVVTCATILYLCKNILTIKIKGKATDFDPFEILDATPETPLEQVKKVYRTKLKAFNKMLQKGELKAKANAAIVNLNRAIELWKNKGSLENWASEGQSRELLIAIPSFVLNFSSPFLAFYIAFIAVAIPAFFLIKHLSFKRVSSSGSKYASNEWFYGEINNFSEVPAIIIHQCIFLAGNTVEFRERKWNQHLPGDTVKIIEMEYAVPVMDDREGYLRILMYLARRIEDPDDREYIRSRTLMLVESYKRIAHNKGRAKVFEALLTLEKMVNQAVINPDFYQLQYPGIKFQDLAKTVLSGDQPKKSLENDENLITSLLTDEKREAALNVLKKIPRVEIAEFKAFTVDTTDENCEFSKEDTQMIKQEGGAFIIPKNFLPYLQFRLVCPKLETVSHTPFSQVPILNKWVVYLKVNDRLEGDVVLLDAFEGEKKIKMSIPSNNMKEDAKIFVVSNGYFGNDASAALTIKFN